MSSAKPKQRIYLTPTPVRIWHWLNALGIVTLCFTGLQIRFPEYFNIFGTYKAAILLHDTAGLAVTISFLLGFLYSLFKVRSLLRQYIPTPDDIKRGLLQQALFYFFHYFQGGKNPHTPSPENKFNAIQKTTYLIIMFLLLPLVIVTGLLLLNVDPLRGWISAIGGIKFLAETHYLLACSFFAFLCVHIYMATLGHAPLAHFRQMWTGWEETETHEKENKQSEGQAGREATPPL